MLFSLNDIRRFSIVAGDNTYPVDDVFVDLNTWSVTYVSVDLGGFLNAETVLIGLDKLGQPDATERSWAAEINEDMLRAAPNWDEATGVLPETGQGVLLAKSGDAQGAGAKVTPLGRASRIHNLPIMGTDGEIGKQDDFLFDAESGKISHIVIDNGRVLPGRQLVVDVESVRRLAADGTHFVVNIDSKTLNDAPQIEETDLASRSWIEMIRSYYQLPI